MDKSKRHLLKWTTPVVLSISLPAHAQTSSTTTAKPTTTTTTTEPTTTATTTMAPFPQPQACDSFPCLNGGTCNLDDSDDGFSCDCLPGTMGDFCQFPDP